MAGLKLRLLGGYEAVAETGDSLALPTKKSRALLAYLALHPGQPLRRADLATLLWGNRFDDQARGSLRQTVYELRSALGEQADAVIETTRETIRLRDGTVDVDVARFEGFAASEAVEDLTEADTLYRASLLDGFETGEEGFDGWLTSERARLHDRACDVLARLASQHIAAGAVDQGCDTARRLLQLDPLGEVGHRLLMTALAADGRRHEALKHFQDFEALLSKELSARPEAQTLALIGSIRRGEEALPGLGGPTTDATGAVRHVSPRSAWAWPRRLGLAVMVALALGGALAYGLHQSGALRGSGAGFETDLALPDKPSIAVLPFTNLTGAADQDYFVDGFTENIITELSRDLALFVIARHSSFAYKGKAMEVGRIAKELGVRYILEGSIQRDLERLRVTVQLIDATTGAHVWSERYDLGTAQLFGAQDEIVRRVVATLRGYKGSIQKAELRRSFAKPPASLSAYENLMRGMMHKERFLREDNVIARRYFETAIELDPNFALAYGWLAWTHFFDVYMGWGADPAAALERTFAHARTSVQLDPDLDFAHWALGAAHLASGQNAHALTAFERALELNPNNSDVLANTAWPLSFRGEPDKAIANMTLAMRLNPHHPDWYWWGLGIAYFTAERYDAAVDVLERMTQQNSESLAYLIASYAALGNREAAGAGKERLIRLEPDFSIPRFAATLIFEQQDVPEKLLSGLESAGLSKAPPP